MDQSGCHISLAARGGFRADVDAQTGHIEVSWRSGEKSGVTLILAHELKGLADSIKEPPFDIELSEVRLESDRDDVLFFWGRALLARGSFPRQEFIEFLDKVTAPANRDCCV